jgi:maleate cis-trans isomerase
VHETESTRRMPCIVPSCTCNLEFYHIENLVNHLVTVHDADIRVEELNFENVNSFEKYLAEESLNKNTRYVLHR